MTIKIDLVKSLATVAIAALGGPVPATAAALKEILSLAVDRYQDGEQTREVLHHVESAVRAWAQNEIDAADVDFGLQEATRIVARFGMSDLESAEVGYDARSASNKIVARAAARDRYWGTEPHHAVAERAIEATYAALYDRIRSEESVLLPAIQVARTQIISGIQALGGQVDDHFAAVGIRLDDLEGILEHLRTGVDRLAGPPSEHKVLGGMLRLSWERDTGLEPIFTTDDFDVSIGRYPTNRVTLPSDSDSRLHGQLSLVGSALQYTQLGSQPTYVLGADRQLRLSRGESCLVSDNDRLKFASGTMLIEFSAPDLFDPRFPPTVPATEGQPAQ